jgi:hypothetical protein
VPTQDNVAQFARQHRFRNVADGAQVSKCLLRT